MSTVEVEGEERPVNVGTGTSVEPELKAHITNLVSALGGPDLADPARPYKLGDDALECLRDLKKWLKGYDERLDRWDVARAISETSLMTVDLPEILAMYESECENGKGTEKLDRVATGCLELLVPLTWPLELNKLTSTVNHYRHAPALEQARLRYKQVLLNHSSKKVLKAVIRLTIPSLMKKRPERSAREEGVLRLCIYLFRNLLAIDVDDKDADVDSATSRNRTITVFREQKVLDFLMTVSAGMGTLFDQQSTGCLECLFYLFRGLKVEEIFEKIRNVEIGEKENIPVPVNGKLKDLLDAEKDIRREIQRGSSSRHNRFGTMISVVVDDAHRYTVSGQAALGGNAQTLKQMDARKTWNARSRRRVELGERWTVTVSLTRDVIDLLRAYVCSFIDAAFNPLFVAVRKEIENDSEKILEVHKMQYLYLVGWFLEAERRRRDIDPRLQENDFGLVGGSLNQHTFVVVMKLMREGFEKGESQNFDVVYASMVCFKQILLTVKAMETSRSDEDKDIASNMKSRLFYEDASLNLLAQLPRNAANRSLAFIRESIELTHVVLKMLEAYSKEHTALFVKTKRRQRKAKKAVTPAEEHDSSENEDEQEESRRVTTERKFEFSRFEAKYITESTLDTYKTFLETYKELSSREIMWVLTFFHRAFVKREARGLFFSLDLISLLSRMTGHSSEGLPHSHPARKDVEQFMAYYTKKLLQSLERTPALFVELLFDKLPEHLFYFDHGHDKQPKQPRTQIEWEFVDGSQSAERKIATVVAALMDDDKQPVVTSLIEQLEQIREKRENWSLESGFASTHPPDEPITKVDTKDGKVRLLLQTMQFPLRPSGRFAVPALFPNERISEWLMYLKKYLSEPVAFESGGVAADQLRIKRTDADADKDDVDYADAASPGGKGAESPSSDDGGEIDGFQDERFKSHRPPDELAALQESRLRDRAKRGAKKPIVKKAKSTRAARSQDKANEKALQRAQAEKEKLAKIKSSAFVNDSDDEDDAEKDKQFFAQELALRRQIEEAHANGVNTQDLFLARKAYKESSVLDDNLFVTDNSDEEPVVDDPTTDTDDDTATRPARKRSVGEDDDGNDSDLLHVTSPEPEPQSTAARSSKRQKNIILDSDEE